MEEWQPAHLWLLAGALFLGIEAFGVSGIGFLFAGLAAIATGILVHTGILSTDQLALQVGVCFGLTAILAALLWQKLKSWRMGKGAGYQNMIGDVALVGKGGLRAGMQGQVSWSGTTMTAEISPKSSATEFAEGAAVEIVEVKGNMLIVAARHA